MVNVYSINMAAEELQTLHPFMSPCGSTAAAYCSTASCMGKELLSKTTWCTRVHSRTTEKHF